MAIHIGEEIKKIVRDSGLSQKEFALKINTTQQNVANIYTRTSIDILQLLQISEVLKFNFLQLYDDVEPLKTYRQQEINEWQSRIDLLTDKLNLCNKLIYSKEETINSKEETLVILRKHMANLEAEIKRFKE